MHRDRTFSDASIAESCIDTTHKCDTLMKRNLSTHILSGNIINNIICDVQTHFGIIGTENILNATEYMYNIITNNKYISQVTDIKIIIVEMLSVIIDKSQKDINYTLIYRPVLKDIIPQFIDILIKNR